MKVIKEHRTMLRDLVNNHAQKIHGKEAEDSICNSIKEDCKTALEMPQNAQLATVKTKPFLKGK